MRVFLVCVSSVENDITPGSLGAEWAHWDCSRLYIADHYAEIVVDNDRITGTKSWHLYDARIGFVWTQLKLLSASER